MNQSITQDMKYRQSLLGAVHLFLCRLPAEAAGVVRPQGHTSGMCPDGQRF